LRQLKASIFLFFFLRSLDASIKRVIIPVNVIMECVACNEMAGKHVNLRQAEDNHVHSWLLEESTETLVHVLQVK
ncbi:hypothetical protein MTO96_039527, partial [Rhipicephalus appendiculatus]